MKENKRPDKTEPTTAIDYVNMYGTYNIQPTADREDEYPAIAQGLSREAKQERERARNKWKEEQQLLTPEGKTGDAADVPSVAPPLPNKRG